MTPTSPTRPRKPRPDALSPEESGRTARDAGRDRRKVGGCVVLEHPREVPTEAGAEAAGAVLRSGSDSIFQGTRGREFKRVHQFPWGRGLQPFSFGGYRRDYPARRVSDVVYAVSGGDYTRDAAGDFRVSNFDVPAHWPRSGQRFDV